MPSPSNMWYLPTGWNSGFGPFRTKSSQPLGETTADLEPGDVHLVADREHVALEVGLVLGVVDMSGEDGGNRHGACSVCGCRRRVLANGQVNSVQWRAP